MTNAISLFRPKVSIMVGLSAVAGACLFDPDPGWVHFYAAVSAISLAFGCSALNQYQERERDRLMQRTRTRPLVTGTLSPAIAIGLAVLMLALSAGCIVLSGHPAGLLLVAFTLLLYNFVYTPLKPKTPFALLIGSLTGAVPPLLGYVVAGGNPFAVSIIIVSIALYLWQTPHFALLVDRYADDYQRAGFKTLSGSYGHKKSRLFINVWLASFFCLLMYIPLTDIYTRQTTAYLHTGIALLFAALMIVFRRKPAATFHLLNVCMAIFFVLLVGDRIRL